MVTSGCVEFDCYSNIDYAIEQANTFCSKGDGDTKICESLKIDGAICRISKTHNNACMALGYGIQTFIRIPYSDCRGLNENICKSKKSCEWNFKDPLKLKFGDFQRSSLKIKK
jgi:hypothetical protein